MNIIVQYFFFSLPLLISFVFSSGNLNNNSYVKEFALSIVVFCQLILVFLQKKSWKKIDFDLKFVDVLLFVLMIVYSLFFINTKNNLDFTLPYIYVSTYYFFRIYLQDNNSDYIKILTKVVPFVIGAHFFITIFQILNILPNFHDFFPARSTFGNPDKLASYLSILLPICYTKQKKKITNIILIVTCVVLFIVIQARTALLSTAVTLICFLFFEKALSKKILWLGVSICLIGLFVLIWWHPDSFWGRIFLWIVALRMFISNPLGYGLYVFQKKFPEAQIDFIAKNPNLPSCFNIDQVVYSPFNEFLNIGLSIGIIGLILYILFIGLILKYAYRNKTHLIYPVISFIVISLSYFPMKIAPINIIMVLISAIIVTSVYSKTIFKIRIIKAVKMLGLALAICCMICKNCHVFYQWEKAIKEVNHTTEIIREDPFFKSYSQLNGNGLFLFSYANYYFQIGDIPNAMCLLEKAEKYHTSISLSLFMSNLHKKMNELEKAEMCLNKAIALSNGQFNPTYELFVFLIKVGEKEEAYKLAVQLYNKPINSTYYADMNIIKLRLKHFIDEYESKRNSM